MKSFFKASLTLALLVAPFSAFADAATFTDVFNNLGKVILTATPVVVALALLAFFWGLVQYLFQSGDPEKRKKGLGLIVWGIIALFVIFSVFGIINVLQVTVGVGNGSIQEPTLSPPSS